MQINQNKTNQKTLRASPQEASPSASESGNPAAAPAEPKAAPEIQNEIASKKAGDGFKAYAQLLFSGGSKQQKSTEKNPQNTIVGEQEGLQIIVIRQELRSAERQLRELNNLRADLIQDIKGVQQSVLNLNKELELANGRLQETQFGFEQVQLSQIRDIIRSQKAEAETLEAEKRRAIGENSRGIQTLNDTIQQLTQQLQPLHQASGS